MMKIALAQLNYTTGDIEQNKEKIINSIIEAKTNGVDMIVFAEYAISGVGCCELLRYNDFIVACEDALVEIASHCDDIVAVVGLPMYQNSKVISAAAIIENRKVIRYIGKRKVVLPEEAQYVYPAKAVSEKLNIKGRKVAIALGTGLMRESLYSDYPEVVVGIWAHPFSIDIIPRRYEIVRTLSYRYSKTAIFLNHLGGQSGTVYDGSSSVYANGRPVAFAKQFEEDFLVVDLNEISDKEAVPPLRSEVGELYEAIKLGLKDFFVKNGFSKACVGLSGGIDSAVVLALAVEVLGKESVKAVLMPSEFSTEHSIDDSMEMINLLGVSHEIVPITEAYQSVLKSVNPIFGDEEFGVTNENLQARIRGMILMALSNKEGYIVLNTSNKSEEAVGYSTLYGDMVGSIGVIGDLYKHQVYRLARYINTIKPVIPENVILKEPSAELRHNQKDSDSLLPYETLDAILYRMVEHRESQQEMEEAGFESQDIRRVWRSVCNSEFKREQAPPTIKVSVNPFMSSYKMPLLHKFK